MVEIPFIEMFAGVGGFRLGFEKTNQKRIHPKLRNRNQKRQYSELSKSQRLEERGSSNSFRCVWANDNDRSACKIYHHRFGYKELIEANIKTINPNTIPNHQILTAGFPCQSFSIAGKRKGFKDTRGTLFYHITRIAEAKQPKLLLLENVKGLLNHDEGITFQIIIESLAKLGYICEWQVLNSKYFGVPQNRERVFIIGHLRGTSSPKIFPIGKIAKRIGETPKGTQRERPRLRIANTLSKRYGKDGKEILILHNVYGGFKEPKPITNALSGVQNDHLIIEDFYKKRKPRITEKAPTLRGDRQGLKILSHSPRTNNPKLGGSGPLLSNEHCFTIDSTPHNLIEGKSIRRLTPIECERLQGFPDGWTKGVSDTQRYMLLGNAVTVNVIEFLGERIKNGQIQAW